MIVKRFLAQVVAVASLLCLSTLQAGKPNRPDGGKGGSNNSYTLVALPDASGVTGLNGYAEGMNELTDSQGQPVGSEVVGIVDGTAYYWLLDASGGVTLSVALPPPAGMNPVNTLTFAKDINDDGIIVGAGGPLGDARPLVWRSLDADPIELAVPASFVGGAVAVEINNHGLVVGWLAADDGTESAVAWGISGETIVGPEVIASGVDVWAPDVNDLGMVVATFEHQAYQWSVDWNGSTLTVSTPQTLTATVLDENGAPQTITLPRVTAINEFGDVCGAYQPPGVGWYQAYLRSAAGEFIEMPRLIDNKRRGTANFSTGPLNNAVELDSIRVAGQFYVYDKRSNFVVDPGGPATWKGDVATDLQAATEQPTPSLFLKGFNDVSDAGWLAGFGWTDNADPRAIVLIPQ